MPYYDGIILYLCNLYVAGARDFVANAMLEIERWIFSEFKGALKLEELFYIIYYNRILGSAMLYTKEVSARTNARTAGNTCER